MLKRWPRSTPGGRATFACRAERKRRRAHSPAYGWEPSGHAALYLDLAEVNGGPRAGGLRRIHLFEDRARVAHLLLRLQVPDEGGRSLCFVDKQLDSGCIDAGRRSLPLLDLGNDLRDPLSGHFSESDDTCVHALLLIGWPARDHRPRLGESLMRVRRQATALGSRAIQQRDSLTQARGREGLRPG